MIMIMIVLLPAGSPGAGPAGAAAVVADAAGSAAPAARSSATASDAATTAAAANSARLFRPRQQQPSGQLGLGADARGRASLVGLGAFRGKHFHSAVSKAQ